VKAPAFDYVAPATLAEALAALGRHGEGAKLLAGGQSLVPALNLRLLAPEILIDLNHVAELRGVTLAGDTLRIGAMTRHAEIAGSALVAAHAPLLTKAAAQVAHAAIRNRGTMGGNLVHADPASEFPACMVALEAEMVLAGPAGERRVSAERFFTGVYATAIEPDEILAAIEVPVIRPGQRHVFLELSRRAGDYALVGVAVRADIAAGQLAAIRPVFFAAGPQPIVARAAAAHLTGAALDEAALARAAAALEADLEPEDDLQITAPVRMQLARTLLRRAVAQLLPGARTREAMA
jgi:carbon-monoxide dehydrogenase medium subunit